METGVRSCQRQTFELQAKGLLFNVDQIMMLWTTMTCSENSPTTKSGIEGTWCVHKNFACCTLRPESFFLVLEPHRTAFHETMKIGERSRFEERHSCHRQSLRDQDVKDDLRHLGQSSSENVCFSNLSFSYIFRLFLTWRGGSFSVRTAAARPVLSTL